MDIHHEISHVNGSTATIVTRLKDLLVRLSILRALPIGTEVWIRSNNRCARIVKHIPPGSENRIMETCRVSVVREDGSLQYLNCEYGDITHPSAETALAL